MNMIQRVRFNNIPAIEEPNISSKRSDILYDSSNPSADMIKIEFELNSSGKVSVLIFDHIANLIKNIECADCKTGKYSIKWNCKNNLDIQVNGGLYYYEVRNNNRIEARKVIIV